MGPVLDFFVCLKEVLPIPQHQRTKKFKVCDATDLWALSVEGTTELPSFPSPSLPIGVPTSLTLPTVTL